MFILNSNNEEVEDIETKRKSPIGLPKLCYVLDCAATSPVN